MTKTLEERAAEVAELKKEITPGDWILCDDVDGNNCLAQEGIETKESGKPICSTYDNRLRGSLTADVGNVKFIAHAPQMAQLIADQQRRIVELESSQTTLRLSKYTLNLSKHTEDMVWISVIEDGEGWEFKLTDIEKIIDDFYVENF